MQHSLDETTTEIVAANSLVERLTKLAYVGVFVGAFVLMAFALTFVGPTSSDPAKWGQFGDYVGGLLNPTFSFLALLALLGTLRLQVRELRLSANELKNSADALKDQHRTMQLQTFEATFFQLLRLHNEIVLSMNVSGRETHSGRACFAFYRDELEGRLIHVGATQSIEPFLEHYDIFFEEYQTDLGHYFRLLYNIVKLVSKTDNIEKTFYTNLVRAQLSSAELSLLFYNCISRNGNEKFKPLVEEFALLKTLPVTSRPDPALIHEYRPSAFGGQYPVPL